MSDTNSGQTVDLGATLMRRKNMMGSFATGEFFTTNASAGSASPEQFNSGEHAVIPAGSLAFGDPGEPRYESITTYAFMMANGLKVTYGQLVALSGDFYANYRRPISNQVSDEKREAVALAAFGMLNQAEHKDEALKILKIMSEEVRAIRDGELHGLPPAVAYQAAGQRFDIAYNVATGGGDDSGITPWYASPGRYLKLASTNWDHFGEHAWIAYLAFHLLAMKTASRAKTDADLALAYAYNAFGDHYLTDMFAAGHIRTPRRGLYACAAGDKGATAPELAEFSLIALEQNASGALAKQMHDEDNDNGLWVESPGTGVLKNRWVAYGDGHYRDVVNYANIAMSQRAVRLSIDQVWQSYCERRVQDPTALERYIPVPLPATGESRVNYSPLYIPGQYREIVQDPPYSVVFAEHGANRRADMHDLLSYQWLEIFGINASRTTYPSPAPRGPSLFPTGTGRPRPGAPPATGTLIYGPDLETTEGIAFPVPTAPLASDIVMGVISPLLAVAGGPGAGPGDARLVVWTDGYKLRCKRMSNFVWEDHWTTILDGQVRSAPALVHANGAYYVYYLGPDGALYQANVDQPGQPVSLGSGADFGHGGGAVLNSAPCAVTDGKRIDVFVTDTASHVRTRHFSGAWTSWEALDGSGLATEGTPTANVVGGTIYLCSVAKINGSLQSAHCLTTAADWSNSPWSGVDMGGQPAPPLNTRASITGWNGDAIYFYWLCSKDRNGQNLYSHMASGQWKKDTWGEIGLGAFIAPPAALTIQEDHIEVFGVGLDNSVLRAVFLRKEQVHFDEGGRDTVWDRLPPIFAITPVVAVPLQASDDKHRAVLLAVINQAFQVCTLVMDFEANKEASYDTSGWQELSPI